MRTQKKVVTAQECRTCSFFDVEHNIENLKALYLNAMLLIERQNSIPGCADKVYPRLLLRSVPGGGAHFAELSFSSWATVLTYTHKWALATGAI